MSKDSVFKNTINWTPTNRRQHQLTLCVCAYYKFWCLLKIVVILIRINCEQNDFENSIIISIKWILGILDGFSLSLSLSRFVEVSLRFHCCCHSLLCKSLEVKHSFAYSRDREKTVFISLVYIFVCSCSHKERTWTFSTTPHLSLRFFCSSSPFLWLLWIRFFCVYVMYVCLYFINCPSHFVYESA